MPSLGSFCITRRRTTSAALISFCIFQFIPYKSLTTHNPHELFTGGYNHFAGSWMNSPWRDKSSSIANTKSYMFFHIFYHDYTLLIVTTHLRFCFVTFQKVLFWVGLNR